MTNPKIVFKEKVKTVEKEILIETKSPFRELPRYITFLVILSSIGISALAFSYFPAGASTLLTLILFIILVGSVSYGAGWVRSQRMKK